MGKTKQAKENKPKFNRNVEISAPILDPEIIKAIHSPPKGGQRVDIRHGGFKALLSDLNSQDSTDELTPLNDNHIPSYIGISCAVSGYSSYNSYQNRRPNSETTEMRSLSVTRSTPNRSRATSPTTKIAHQVNHIVIDKSHITSPDEERKELTEKLTASATERRRSPSPMVPPTEDDRHHGAYVGARYCPLPPPSKVINKRIPLLGIDDDQNMDDLTNEDEHKVEQKIASLYGDTFVEDWRESQTHKTRKELPDSELNKHQQEETSKTIKDLVTLRPTPKSPEPPVEEQPQVETPNVKVLAGVEKQFLTRLLSDENPPMPKLPQYEQVSPQPPTPSPQPVEQPAPVRSPSPEPVDEFMAVTREEVIQPTEPSPPPLAPESPEMPASPSPQLIEQRQPSVEFDMEPEQQQQQQDSPIRSPDSGKSQSISGEDELINLNNSQVGTQEQNIEYEIRAQSPLDNQSSPVRMAPQHHHDERLVSFSPDISQQTVGEFKDEDEQPQSLLTFEEQPNDDSVNNNLIENDFMASGESPQPLQEQPQAEESHQRRESTSQPEGVSSETLTQDGHYYLGLLGREISFINEQVAQMESVLEAEESQMDEETVGRIRSAIGKANLLVNKKCNQFRELCESNISSQTGDSSDQFATLNDDLAGFWDMLNLQFGDVRKSFEALWEAQSSGWQFPDLFVDKSGDEEALQSRSSSRSEKVTAKSKLSAQKDQERKQRLQEHINQMKQQAQANKSNENLLLEEQVEIEQQD